MGFPPSSYSRIFYSRQKEPGKKILAVYRPAADNIALGLVFSSPAAQQRAYTCCGIAGLPQLDTKPAYLNFLVFLLKILVLIKFLPIFTTNS